MRVYLNGRFLTQRLTGVQRAALCTVQALDQMLGSGELDPDEWHFELLVPPGAREHAALQHIRMLQVGSTAGHVWEQFELPWHSRHGLLVSLANAAPLMRKRQCVTLHDASTFAIPESYSPLFRMWYQFLLPSLGRRAELIITDSLFSQGELVHRAGISRSKIRVVPLGSEHILAVAPDESILANHRLGSRPYILTVSSQSPHKNHRRFCEALAHLDRNRYDVVVVGGTNPRVFKGGFDPSREEVRQLGYIPDSQLRALYSHARCFVYPSLYEGFGLPPLEAMRCGCPVVVSRAASLPEICGAAAIYCDPYDPADIARGISRVMEDAALRLDLKNRGFERAREFTWQRSARGLVGALREAWVA